MKCDEPNLRKAIRNGRKALGYYWKIKTQEI